MECTARKIRKGSKFVVVVTVDGVEHELGGKRAERAEAAIVTRWGHRPAPNVYGLRASLPAAQTEAHRLATQTTIRHGGAVIPCTTADEAIAVRVEVPA